MAYTPPKDIYEVNANLQYDVGLDKEHEHYYVPTAEGRGRFSFNEVYKAFGVSTALEVRIPPRRKYHLFCGHRGCGKSTELIRLADRLHKPDRFFVIFLDTLKDLDPNNLRYVDVLMALAKELFVQIENSGLTVDAMFLRKLSEWFFETVQQNAKTQEVGAEMLAGASAEPSIPFIGKLFAKITNSFRYNASYKEELRNVIKNTFSTFAEGFNQLILAVEEAIIQGRQGKRLLFVIDGTDRLESDDSERFFIQDVNQLQQIDGLFIYCAPIHLLAEGNQVQQAFSHSKLPMIKTFEKNGEKNEVAFHVLRSLLYQRADPSLFDSEGTVDYLIAHSGGCPRELLRLLEYAYQFSETDLFDRASAEEAVKKLSSDYRYWLNPEDYSLLRAVDAAPDQLENSDAIRKLLYNLALLEYNDVWRRSHPVVRLLSGYKNAAPEAK